MNEIVNKVEQSGLINLDLEEMYPVGERRVIDLKDQLWEGLALKEKDFRAWLKEHDWSQYTDAFVAIHCSADAIIPTWAFMLVATKVEEHAKLVTGGDAADLEQAIFTRLVANMDLSGYADERVIVKGCSRLPVPLSAYVELSARLRPVVKSLMFGEACSTVPLYKQPKG